MKAVNPFLRRTVGSTALCALLIGCGGGGGGGVQSDGNALLSGVLLDSAVSGVHYDGSLTGLDGRYFYLAGDVLRFHLGGIELGSVTGRAQTTPYDLAGSHDDYKHDRVIRTARLLQSLDGNGVLADGIQVSDSVRSAASGVTLDWTLAGAAFERALSDLVFTLTAGQGTVVSAEDAQAHLHNTLTSTVESCTSLPRNDAHFAINNPRCLDLARMSAWLEDVKPREQALDAAIESLAGGGVARTTLDQLVALVPTDTTGVSESNLHALAVWVADRVAGNNSGLRSSLGAFLAVRYTARVFGPQPCDEPCAEPTADAVTGALIGAQATTSAAQWQQAVNEARVARAVVENWLAYGFNRAALLANAGADSLRDRTPLLDAAAASLGLTRADFRPDVVDGWAAQQLALNDIALSSRGTFDSTLSNDPTASGIRVSDVSHDNLVVGGAARFLVRGQLLGDSLVLNLSGCTAALTPGGSSEARQFTCTVGGTSGWRTLTVSDGLTQTELYSLAVFVQSAGADAGTGNLPSDDGGTGTSPGPVDDVGSAPTDPTGLTVSSIAPTSALLGKQTVFTVTGSGFTPTTSVRLAACGNFSANSRTAIRMRFTCTPEGQPGNRALTVTEGNESDNQLRVRFDGAAPTVTRVTPVAATVGEAVSFTVTGTNLDDGLSFAVQQCDPVSPLSGATATSRRFRCTFIDAGDKAGTVLYGGDVIHRFSVTVAAASNPEVTSVTPETARMSEPLTLTVKGQDLPDALSVSLEGCANLSAASRSATEQTFTCQPSQPGNLVGTVSVDTDTLYRFTVDVIDDRVTISSVRPGATRLGAITTFTVSGEALPSTLALDIENCVDMEPLGGGVTRRQFRCTPTGALGTRDVGVLFDADSATPLHTHKLTVAGDGPLVTNVSPTQATVGRLTTFTVVGQSLTGPLSLRMAGCAVSTVGTSSASVHRFRCSVTGDAGTREATVVDSRSGTVLYALDVRINAGT
ncbi:MAG: hypothetical protein AAF460_12205 [Pseudomonadota bacterium]